MVRHRRRGVFRISAAGKYFTNFQHRPDTENTIPHPFINALLEVNEEEVWVGARTRDHLYQPQPGALTLRVRASNNDGLWNETGTTLQMIIAPPWWQTGWAYLAYALLSFGLLALGYRFLLRRQHLSQQLRLGAEPQRHLHPEPVCSRGQAHRFQPPPDHRPHRPRHGTHYAPHPGVRRRTEPETAAAVELPRPKLVKAGLTVTLFGQSLRGAGEQSDKDKFQLAINHQPVDAHIELWTDQMVIFSLDAGLLGKYNSSPRLWVSLLLNGAETNALPFTVEAVAKEKPKEAPAGKL